MDDYRVDAIWDAEAGVFVATSADIPGLIVESADMGELLEKVTMVARALLSRVNAEGGKIMVHLKTVEIPSLAA